MTLQPHQQRVIDEQKELQARLEKLDVFIDGEVFKTLDTIDQRLLNNQREHMANYNETLFERIERFDASK